MRKIIKIDNEFMYISSDNGTCEKCPISSYNGKKPTQGEYVEVFKDENGNFIISPLKNDINDKKREETIQTIIGFITLIVIIFFVKSCSSCNHDTSKDLESAANSVAEWAEKQADANVEKQFVDISCYEFCAMFNAHSNKTELQKKNLFEKEFKNKYVKWQGRVSSISDGFLGLTVQVKCSPHTLVTDLIISFDSDEKDKLLSYSEGSLIKFEARLDRYGELVGHSLSHGKLIE